MAGGTGGGTTTHTINIAVNAQPLAQLQQAANQAGQAVAGIGQGGAAAGLGSIASGAMGAANAVASIVNQAFDAAKALSDMAKEGAKLQTLDAAFKALGGSAQQMSELRDLTGGLVSDEDLQQASNLAKLFKLPAEEIPKLIKLAQGASAALGTTVAKSISDTFTAASRQSKMIADNMGIVIGDMSIMYSNYAKKHGKTVDQLTDKDKQLAFVQKMIAEGGRQMELATIGQGNAALKAEAQMANFERSLKMAAAEAFASTGAYDMMGGVLSQLQVAFTENGDALAELVMPAFKAVGALVVPLAQTFGALLPLLEPIAKLFGLLGATLTALAPIIGLLSTLIAKLASFIIDIVFIALQPLLEIAGEVAGVFDDDLAASFAKAAEMIDKAGVATESVTKGLTAEGEVVERVAQKWGILGQVRAEVLSQMGGAQEGTDEEKFASRLGLTPEQLSEVNANMETFTAEYTRQLAFMAGVANSTDLKTKTVDELNEMVGAVRLTADETVAVYQLSGAQLQKALIDRGYSLAEQSKMELHEAQNLVKGKMKADDEMRSLERKATERAGKELAARMGLEGEAADRVIDLLKMKQQEKATAEVKANEQALQTAADGVRRYNQMAEDSANFQTNTLASMVAEGAQNEKAALEKLDGFYDEHIAHIQKLYGEGTAEFVAQESILAGLVNDAAEKMKGLFDKDKGKGKGKGGKAPDWYKAEWDARLSMMDDYSRQSAEIETRYADQMGSLHADQVQLRIDLAFKMVEELDALEAKRVADEKARALELSNYFKSEQEVQLANDIAAATARAEAMREIARQNGQDNIEMMRAIAAQEDKEKLGAYGAQFGGAGAALGETFGAGFGGLGDAYTALFDNQKAAEDATKAHEEKMAGMYQNMATSAVDSMIQIAVGGADMRENMFKLMGSMFGQLSTAFLAWATAEGALLSGNPFAAAAAAIALGAVASTISAFGSRGKGSGAKGTSSKMSRQSLESRKEDEKPQTIIYNYGFATPDAIARSVSRGDLRGQDLRGREKA